MAILENLRFWKNWGAGREKTIGQSFDDVGNLNKIGVLGITVDKDTELYLTPQKLMFLSYMCVELHPELFSSYTQYVNFFVGKGIRSRNPEIDSKILADKLKINLEVKKGTWNYLITGNVYAQKFYDKTEVNKGIVTTGTRLQRYTILRDSSRLAYNFDAKTDNEFWLYEMHYTGSGAIKNRTTQFMFIKYALQQLSNVLESKYVIKLDKKEIAHLRSPYGRNDYYGHSTLMSGWGYSRSLKEIIDNIFRIAKYQAIGKKIISFTDETGKPITTAELQELENQFFTNEKDVMFTNKKINSISINYQGEYQSMSEELDYVRKALMSGSIPTFLTAFAGDFNNRSLGDDSLIGFFMNLESDRELILHFFNDLFVELWGIKGGNADLYFEDAKVFVPKEDGDSQIGNEEDNMPQMKTTVKTPTATKTTTEPIIEEPVEQQPQ